MTGVSGSGKSSLLNDTLAPALAECLMSNDELKTGTSLIRRNGPKGALHESEMSPFSIRGADQIDKLVEIDQSPIGRTPRSSPATYTGVFDDVRKVFATTKDARARGYRAGRFSFNNKAGRCEECQGHGQKRIEMNFLPDLYVKCPVCEGKRFNRQTLEVRYRGLSIADVLDLSVDDAAGFFENHPAIARMLASLKEVGLGYVALGQSSITLSGGEAQRVKLAAELGRVDTGKTFYILDEPTTGLHFNDVKKLLAVARPAGRSGQHSGRHRAQRGRDEDGRLDHRPRSRRRRGRRTDRRHRHAGADRGDQRERDGEVFAGSIQ